MKSTRGCLWLAACLLAMPVHAQLALTLPRVTGVNLYFEPAVLWLPGGALHARRAGCSYGLEMTFDVGRLLGAEYRRPEHCRAVKDGVLLPPSTRDESRLTGVTREGNPCRICYVSPGTNDGLTAWGERCHVAPGESFAKGVDVQLALGYGQTASYGRSPLFLVQALPSRSSEVFGVIRNAPTTALYFTVMRPHAGWEPYGALTLSLAILAGQVTPDALDGSTPPATFSLSAMTLAPGLRLGLRTRSRLFADLGYEWRSFPLVEVRSSPGVTVPAGIPQSLLIHSVQLRVGTSWSMEGG